MPLSLPPGYVPFLTPLTAEQRLVTTRETAYRFEMLTFDEAPLGDLDGEVSGGLEWSATASIKGSGTLTVTDVDQGVDWLNVRIRPVVIIEGYGEVQLGIWLAAAPVEHWSSLGRSWEVELIDKSAILDQDVYANAITGQASTFSASVGDNVIELIRELIVGVGEDTASLEVGTAVLANSMIWDVGTTRLKIINDLLDASGYFSLFVDGAGQFRAVPYAPPAQREVLYEALAPFVVGPTAVLAPDWTKDQDIYSIPNRFVAIGQGDSVTAALVSTATNTDPLSPFSYSARGRWVTAVETSVEAVDQAALDTYAQRRLLDATSVAASFDVQHLYLPGLTVNSVIRLVNPDAGVDVLCSVSKTTVAFDPLALVSTTLKEVLDI